MALDLVEHCSPRLDSADDIELADHIAQVRKQTQKFTMRRSHEVPNAHFISGPERKKVRSHCSTDAKQRQVRKLLVTVVRVVCGRVKWEAATSSRFDGEAERIRRRLWNGTLRNP